MKILLLNFVNIASLSSKTFLKKNCNLIGDNIKNTCNLLYVDEIVNFVVFNKIHVPFTVSLFVDFDSRNLHSYN